MHPHGSQRGPNNSSREGAHILYQDICMYFPFPENQSYNLNSLMLNILYMLEHI